MMLNREIISAARRLPRAAPYYPWRQEIGNLTADIQSVRKSSWLCLRNIRTFRIRSLNHLLGTLDQAATASCLMISLASKLVSLLSSTAFSQYFGHLMWRADSPKKTLMLGKTEGKMRRGRQRMRWFGWHHRLNGHEFKQTPGDREGQGSLACCSPWARKESDRLSYSPPPSPAVSPHNGQSDLLQHLSDRASSSEGTPPSGQWVLLTPRLAFYHCSHWPGVPPHVLIWFVHFIPSVPSTNITFHATPVLTTL